MSDTFYIVLAYALTYVVLAGYALRLRAARRRLAVAATEPGRTP
jgi:heme exporter protein D